MSLFCFGLSYQTAPSQQVARNHDPTGGALHSAFSGLLLVGADRPFAGVAFSKMRRPGAQRTFNTLGLKTSLGRSTRSGSRSSPRVWVCFRISPALGPRTEPVLMRLPSAVGGKRPLTAATSLC